MKRLSFIYFFVVAFFTFSSHCSLRAQLCQGSLGAPLVNITFGAGGSSGSALPGATTSYVYVTNDCPSDGFYTVRGNTNSCFSNSWHTLAADHTGDTGGYFMLVNASIQPGAFYTDTVKGLCPSTTFEFASWVLNVLRQSACGGNGTKPNLTFSIEKTDGNIIQQYSTGDINQTATPQWVQYGFFFTTPAGVNDVVLRIFNNSPGGCGNDLALDDITFRPCGPLITTAITSTGGTNATACANKDTSYNLSSSISAGYSNPVYQWQLSYNGGPFLDIANAINSSLPITISRNAPSGIYSYKVVVAESGNINYTGCRVNSSIVTITVEPPPNISFTTNSPVCAGSELKIEANGNASIYYWNGPNGFSASGNSFTIYNTQSYSSGKYYLKTSTNTCIYFDSTEIIVNPKPLATVNITNAAICEQDTLQLVGGGGNNYLWQPAISLSTPLNSVTKAFPASSTTYNLIVKNNFNCADTVTTFIRIIKKATAKAGPDLFTISGTPIRLQSLATGDSITYQWLPSAFLDSSFILKPLVNAPAGEHIYKLSVNSSIGCGFAPDEVKVTVYDKLYIPSAFTPNNDGKNDRWFIPALQIFSDAEVIVYNRYGEIVFSEKGNFNGWDGRYKGKEAPIGTYIYIVKTNGTSQTSLLKGILTLIR